MKNKTTSIAAIIFTMVFTAAISCVVTFIVVSKKFNEMAVNQNVFSKVSALNTIINENYINEIDKSTLTDNLVRAYLSSIGDKYAMYYTKDEYRITKQTNDSIVEGIGVTLTYREENNDFIITYVMENSPAKEAGINIGDRIVRVGEAYISEIGKDEAMYRMKGDVGTTVAITIIPKDKTEEKELFIKREQFVTTTVDASMYDDMGIIRIREFNTTTPDEFKAAYEDLLSKGMHSVIFDVRNNPGGDLDSVLSVLEKLIGNGTLVTIKYKNSEKIYTAKNSDEIDIPAVVLINGNSASAAELFSACLRDHQKATLIGTNTYGKVVGQRTFKFQDDSAVKFTVFTYLPPSGVSFEAEGIAPNVVVTLDEELEQIIYGLDITNDAQLQEAIKSLGGTLPTTTDTEPQTIID